jgi:arsenate reductase
MNKIYYLSSCDTCRRIISELNLKEKNIVFQDIKTEKITLSQLKELKKLSGSYEALFNKKARKYKDLNLIEKNLSEDELEKCILNEYTFLKRPVIVFNNQLFIGNAKQTINEAKKLIF